MRGGPTPIPSATKDGGESAAVLRRPSTNRSRVGEIKSANGLIGPIGRSFMAEESRSAGGRRTVGLLVASGLARCGRGLTEGEGICLSGLIASTSGDASRSQKS